MAQLAFDMTALFCERYIDKFSRTRDQMVQAARSGTQNIAEGSKASGTSKKTELKLTNVARASLEELKLDYVDYLRQRGLEPLPFSGPSMIRFKSRQCNALDDVRNWVAAEREAGVSLTSDILAANAALAILNLADYCLGRQINQLSETFEREGGITERLYRVRTQRRKDRPQE